MYIKLFSASRLEEHFPTRIHEAEEAPEEDPLHVHQRVNESELVCHVRDLPGEKSRRAMIGRLGPLCDHCGKSCVSIDSK